MPLLADHQEMQSTVKQHEGLLSGVEAVAIEEASADSDAAALHSLGLFWSEGGSGGFDVRSPLFGPAPATPGWALDAAGSHIPWALAKAEDLLLQAESASEGEECIDRGAKRALRLYQHAKFLALKHHDVAAVRRYRSAAAVAILNQRKELAAHALTRLSYFFMLRGKHQDALLAANEALAHRNEPLAHYIQATLRRSLGYLKSAPQIRAAEQQLRAVKGLLPSKQLESSRETAVAELSLWGKAAVQGSRACFALLDAARVLICLICRQFFL